MTFHCERCGYCCTLKVVLASEEIEKISKAGYADFYEQEGKNFLLKRKENSDCIFLERKEGTTRCTIYPHRPKPCRDYPKRQEGLCKDVNPKVRAYLYRITENQTTISLH